MRKQLDWPSANPHKFGHESNWYIHIPSTNMLIQQTPHQCWVFVWPAQKRNILRKNGARALSRLHPPHRHTTRNYGFPCGFPLNQPVKGTLQIKQQQTPETSPDTPNPVAQPPFPSQAHTHHVEWGSHLPSTSSNPSHVS